MALHLSIACAASLMLSMAAVAAPGDPLDARAVVPAPVHRSAFDAYRRHDDVQPQPWRQANDTVEHIGGWRSYLREGAGSRPAAAASSPAIPAAPPAPAPAPPASRPPTDPHRH